MAVQLPLPDLIQKMKGVDTLNGWDVLVSYTDTMLNKLLEERAAKMGTLSPVSWQAVFIGRIPYTSAGNRTDMIQNPPRRGNLTSKSP